MIFPKRKDGKLQRVDQRIEGTKLYEKLKKQSFRRNVVRLGFILPFMFAYVLMWAAWSFMAPNPETGTEKLMAGLFWVVIALQITVSYLISATVHTFTPHEGELYDERQSMEYLQARSDALSINGYLLFAMIVAGFAILIMNVNGMLSFTHPNYSGIHYYLGLAGATVVASKLSTGMLLAWRLPDMTDDEEGDSNDQ